MNALKVVTWIHQENVDTERLSLELGPLRAEVVDQDGDRSVWSVTLNSIEVARGSADNLSPEYHFDSAREAAECALARGDSVLAGRRNGTSASPS